MTTTTAALAVDDDHTIRRLIVRLLQRAGFDPVDSAADGAVALEKMRDTHYLLVVLDLRMPRVSGYDVLADLARNPLPNMPKIIVVTADRQASTQPLDSEVVTAMLAKPFEVETFISTVQSCLPEDATGADER
jgi:two-component system response regulator PilR (NtrC family)